MKAPARIPQLALGAILVFAAIMAAGSVAPVHAAANVTFDGSCLPSSIRPGEDALVTCTSTFTNSGDETALNVTQDVTITDGLPAPTFIFSIFSQTFDGEPVYVNSWNLVREFGDLAPGQTLEVVTEIIFNVGVGPHGGLINISASGEFVTSGLLQIDGDPDSPYPPTNLTITKTLTSPVPGFVPPSPISPPDGVTEPISPPFWAPERRPPPPAPLSHGGPISPPIEPHPSLGPMEFEIVVRNESDVFMAGVTLRDKYPPGVEFVLAEPAAAEVNETTHIVRWDLGPLGPGEEARVTLELTSGGGCFSLQNPAVTTALGPDGEEHYVDFWDEFVPCGGQGGDGLGNAEDDASPVALPSTGSDAQNVGVGWAWQVAAVALTLAAALGFVAYRLVKPRP